MSEVRTRFAPSPTGFFHIGSARTALFNWLYARHTGGTFVLRIEDTDKERNTQEFLDVILESMRWLGMDWDEGPQVGGDYGPYFQSQRGDFYKQKVRELMDKGRAYEKDGAIWFRLEGERETVYDDFLKKEIERVHAAPVVIDDIIRGRVERAEDRDFVIVRGNGEPVFHLVNVVDDIAMKITHVIRGEDHLSNTSKHVELYKAFGVEPPKFAHIPLILKTEGSGKMSKRDRGALIEEYQSRHFLPAAVRNFLCMLGWTPKDGREILPIEDIVAQFDLCDVHQANARFDERKMAFFNQEYLRALPDESFAWLAAPVLGEAKVIDEKTDEDYLQKVLALCKPKMNALETLPNFVGYFFTEDFPLDEKGFAKLRKKSDPAARCRELVPALEAAPDVAPATVDAIFAKLGAEHGVKPTDYFAPMRFAVSGQPGGPGLHEMLELLGKERTLSRVKKFIAKIEAM
ncbi:glutamate--tRNA ligase [Candidatus Spyradosoma sp. SGI.093]|uniref:glutamate--tRNA ligase n=1 Tax=Candidatus Spyradosoma sp. SGI.093 TaxID=3420583 RepID=UPI003D00070D